jgi:histidine ammonia-lyase
MGWGAARKLRAALDNLAGIIGIELVAAARGLELRQPLEPAAPTAAALAAVREGVPGFGADRWLSPELEAAKRLVRSGTVLEAVEANAGALL